jgi:pilus assembly protein Flp/PilA
MSLYRTIQRFLASEDGPTAVEYAVMLAMIIAVCMVAINNVGTSTTTVFNNTANSMAAAS